MTIPLDSTWARVRRADPLQLAAAIIILVIMLPVVVALAILLGAIVVVLGSLGFIAWSVHRLFARVRQRWPNDEGRENVRVITRDR